MEDLRQIYSPDGSPLRNYQMGLLAALLEIDKFCKQNDVKYSLSAGTLLGAMRHKGFIPWDDDADTMMTRSEFDKLKGFCDKKGRLTDSLSIVYDLRPTFKYGHQIIDIFVEDVCPDSKFCGFVKLTIARMLGTLIKCKLRLLHKNVFKPFKWWVVFIPIACPFRLTWLQHSIQKVSLWGNGKKSRYISCYTDSVKDMGHKYPSNMFDGYTTAEFEGHEFPIVKNYEMQLSELYGDWHKIPDEKGRVWLARVESDVKIRRK